MKNPIKYIDVSLDFDFFFYVDPMLEWAHREEVFFLDVLWHVREQGLSLTGTSLEKLSTLEKADFHPKDLVKKLGDRGMKIGSWTKVTLAESHGYQYSLSKESRNDLVLIDAHTDIWNPGEVNCASWLYFLLKEGIISKATAVLPSWQDRTRVTPPTERRELGDKFSVCSWKNYCGFSGEVRVANLFICRSGCWVPPHHDRLIGTMVVDLMKHTDIFYKRGDIDILVPREVKYKEVRHDARTARAVRQTVGLR